MINTSIIPKITYSWSKSTRCGGNNFISFIQRAYIVMNNTAVLIEDNKISETKLASYYISDAQKFNEIEIFDTNHCIYKWLEQEEKNNRDVPYKYFMIELANSQQYIVESKEDFIKLFGNLHVMV